MDLLIKNKKAFISGSSEGIGFAIAEQLVKEGVQVVLNGRNEDKLITAQKKISDKYPECIVNYVVSDFANLEDLHSLAEEIGDVDILINNVGLFEQREFKYTAESDWLNNFNINVMSGVKLSQLFLPSMLDNGWGRIIFVGSEFASNVEASCIQYGVAKSAVSALSNGLSKLTKNTNVTVNTILAGATYSDGVSHAIQYYANLQNVDVNQMKDSFFKQANPNSLINRFLDPQEIANIAVFLASPLSVAINGTAIRADAGNLKVV